MEPIRVLHVLHSMNCGGAETLLMNLYRKMPSEIQFDFLVNVFDHMYYEDEILERGGRIYRMPFLTAVTPPIYEKKLYAFFKEHREYKIVHSHLETTTGLILKQAKRAGVPMRLAHSHNTRNTKVGLLALPENLFKSYCRTKIVPNATHLLGCSKLACEFLYGKSSAKSKVVANGIDAAAYAYTPEVRNQKRAELDIPQDALVLGHVGRFFAQKNHDFLLDIFADFAKENTNARLLLAGDGELRRAMEEKAEKLGVKDRVHFLGVCRDIPALLQAVDVFVMPSVYEGLPLALVEAQAAGLPCLISDTVSAESDLGCGLVTQIPLGDTKPWVDALKSDLPRRRITTKDIEAAGFDVAASADYLKNLYLSL